MSPRPHGLSSFGGAGWDGARSPRGEPFTVPPRAGRRLAPPPPSRIGARHSHAKLGTRRENATPGWGCRGERRSNDPMPPPKAPAARLLKEAAERKGGLCVI